MNDYSYRIVDDHEDSRWKVFARQDRKVEAIKEFRTITGSGLKEAKDIVEEYNERLILGTVKAGASVSVVKLPDGGMLTVKTEHGRSKIEYSNVEANGVSAYNLPQAIADAVLKYSR